MMDYHYINAINSPADLRKLPVSALPEVCAELRHFIIRVLSEHPGHLASSLGAVELTVALHYVMQTPDDQLVWDVGHQAYAHKILTGRRDRFHTNRQFHGISPFPNPAESEYDAFIAGHASNSISAALGMAVAEPDKHIVAIIGDGAMTGGLAYEGLNNVSMTKSNLLIVLNDNNMAIDPIRGGMTQYLLDITTSGRYNRLRYQTYLLLKRLGLMSDHRKQKVQRFNNSIKSVLSNQQQNIFSGLNLRYFGPADGHDVIALVKVLSEIKDYQGPKVLHLITQKGKGYAPAEENQTIWHAPGKFDPETGERITGPHKLLWQEVFGNELLRLAKEDEHIVGITPAMPSGCSMNIMQRELPDRVFDVGIAEGHAVTFSAGLAKAGKLPVCNIYSSFLQRSYDNIIHDVALPNLHVVLCIDRAGIVGQDGATHHGLLDMAFLRPIPNMHIASPRTADDLRLMMQQALYQISGPVAIRYPRGAAEEGPSTPYPLPSTPTPYPLPSTPTSTPYPLPLKGAGGSPIFKAHLLREASAEANACVLSIGPIGNTVAKAIQGDEAKGEKPLDVAHYDMRWLKPLDTATLDEVGQRFHTVHTVEDGVIDGGLGSAVLEYLADKGYPTRVIRLGVRDQFVEHGSPDELYHLLHLDAEGIRKALSA